MRDGPASTALDAPRVDLAPLPADAGRSPDALAVDSAPVARSCYRRYPGASFCDDFEDGLPMSTAEYGFVVTPNGSVSLERTIVARGSASTSARVGDVFAEPPARRLAFYYATLATPVSSGSLYVRFFAHVPASATLSQWTVLGELTSEGADRIKLSHVVAEAFEFWVTTSGSKDTLPRDSVPRGTWMCIEIAVTVAGGNAGRAELFVNGTSRSVASGNTRPAGGWTGFNFGAIADGAAAGAHVLIDDVVIGPTRVGCN